MTKVKKPIVIYHSQVVSIKKKKAYLIFGRRNVDGSGTMRIVTD